MSAHADGEPMCSKYGFSSSFHPHGEHVSQLRDFFILRPPAAVLGRDIRPPMVFERGREDLLEVVPEPVSPHLLGDGGTAGCDVQVPGENDVERILGVPFGNQHLAGLGAEKPAETCQELTMLG